MQEHIRKIMRDIASNSLTPEEGVKQLRKFKKINIQEFTDILLKTKDKDFIDDIDTAIKKMGHIIVKIKN